MKMEITGTGSELAKGLLTNDDLTQFMETSDEWIRERTGIEKRHVSLGESVADLATAAALKALEDAKADAKDIELIIVASCSAEDALPCLACQVQSNIGADKAVAFDLNAACAGFLFALNTTFTYLKSGIYKNALVIGAEVLSKIIDWTDRGTGILFGDGAGAVYVEAKMQDEDNYRFLQRACGAKGSVLSCVNRDINNPLYKSEVSKKEVVMDGKEVFRFAVGTIPACIEELLSINNIDKEEIDLFLLHQANKRIITSIAKKLGTGMEKFPTNVEKVGNMSSASIPVLLDECKKSGLLKKGKKVVLSGFGAGLTYGASVIDF